MSRSKATGAEKRRVDQSIYAGIATLGTIGLFSLVSRTEMSSTLHVAMFCLSIAWPLSGSIVIALHFHDPSTYDMPRSVFVLVSGYIACVLTAVGVTAIFAHFSWIYAVAFVSGLAAAFIVLVVESGDFYGSVDESALSEPQPKDNDAN